MPPIVPYPRLCNYVITIRNDKTVADWLATMADIDWVDVNKRLPYKRTDEEKEKRKQLWRGIDINGNGYVSLAEITKVGISYRLIRTIRKENSQQTLHSKNISITCHHAPGRI